jgi:hypothetical protein
VTGSIDWFVSALRARREIVADEVGEHFTVAFVEEAGAEGIAGGMTAMAVGLKVVDPISTEADGTVRIPLGGAGTFAQYRVRVGIEGDRLSYFDFGPMEIEGIDIDAKPTAELTDDERAGLHRVFDDAYVDGDHRYLDEQLEQLATVALARSVDEGVVGFALSDARVVDLPGLPAQVLRTAGLSCVVSNHKRKGISSRLEATAMAFGDAPAAEHLLLASRFAHAAGLHNVRRRVPVIPRPDHRPTAWQREVAAAVASVLGVASFDPDAFVCHGPGRPVGKNVIDLDVPDEEAALFAPVDRTQGDTLLALWWTTPPPGWDD